MLFMTLSATVPTQLSCGRFQIRMFPYEGLPLTPRPFRIHSHATHNGQISHTNHEHRFTMISLSDSSSQHPARTAPCTPSVARPAVQGFLCTLYASKKKKPICLFMTSPPAPSRGKNGERERAWVWLGGCVCMCISRSRSRAALKHEPNTQKLEWPRKLDSLKCRTINHTIPILYHASKYNNNRKAQAPTHASY
jgi:hypothetical protein